MTDRQRLLANAEAALARCDAASAVCDAATEAMRRADPGSAFEKAMDHYERCRAAFNLADAEARVALDDLQQIP